MNRDTNTQFLFDVSERKFRTILEAIPDATLIIDEAGTIVFVNAQTENLFGYQAEHLLGEKIEILIPEPYRSRHPNNRVNYFNAPRNRSMGTGMELYGQRQTGEIFPVEISLSPLETKDNVFAIAAIRDITERKLAEERLRKILEATPDATVIINESGKITFANTQTEQVFGYQKEELINQSVEILIPEPYRNRHPHHRKNYFVAPKNRPMGSGMKLLGLRKNGEIFPVEICLSPLETRDGVIALATIRDITERKLFEKTLHEKNMELESANLAKDRFLANMSHELRTPLNAIIGFTGTLLMKLPGPLNIDQEKQLNTVKSSAKHLLSLINDLLDLSKIQSGKVELHFEKVNCQEVIEEIAKTLSPLAETKGLKFNISLPSERINIMTDRRSLTQIIINLANNSIKFTDKGSITIQLEKKLIDNNLLVAIDIIDTGSGIKLEDQHKLFQAFQQIASVERSEGTGLGLFLSQKLVALINGKIEIESEYGNGSRFTIELPMDKKI